MPNYNTGSGSSSNQPGKDQSKTGQQPGQGQSQPSKSGVGQQPNKPGQGMDQSGSGQSKSGMNQRPSSEKDSSKMGGTKPSTNISKEDMEQGSQRWSQDKQMNQEKNTWDK